MNIENNKKYTLVEPNSLFYESWTFYVKELKKVDLKIIPANLEAETFSKFLENINRLKKGIGLPQNYVPSELYFLIEEKEPTRILGVTDIRIGSNYMINNYFGHAGGSILPSERGRGLGSIIINLSISKLREKGITDIILTCEDWNNTSKQAIKANGGVLLGTTVFNSKTYERYLIS